MRIASIQLALADRPKGQNVEHALSMVDRVPSADLILLPEIWPCGFFAFDRYAADSEPLDGPTVNAFRQKARRLVQNPPKPKVTSREDAFIHAMPAYLGGSDRIGLK